MIGVNFWNNYSIFLYPPRLYNLKKTDFKDETNKFCPKPKNYWKLEFNYSPWPLKVHIIPYGPLKCLFFLKKTRPLKVHISFLHSTQSTFYVKNVLWLSLPIITCECDISDRFLARKGFICLIVSMRLKNTAYKVWFCMKIYE